MIIYIFCMLALYYIIYQYLCSITLCSMFWVIIKVLLQKKKIVVSNCWYNTVDCYKCWIYVIDLVLNVCKPWMCEKLDWLTGVFFLAFHQALQPLILAHPTSNTTRFWDLDCQFPPLCLYHTHLILWCQWNRSEN